MISMTLTRTACLCAMAAGLLAACGGDGGGDDATPLAGTNFAAAYNTGVSQMNSAAGLASAAFQDTFASNYLDSGLTKPQLLNGMKLDAAALAASTEFSLFPLASLSNVSLSNCDSQGVCTLSATLTNGDAETVSVPFTTQVVINNGTVRLLGDQQAG